MTAREAHAWRQAARAFWALLAVTMCLMGSIAMNLYQAGQPKLLPHTVMIDPGGQILWESRHGQFTPEGVEMGAFLQKWLWNSRRRGEDLVLMGEMRREAELLSTGKALRQLQAYHAATNPKCPEKTPGCRELKQNPVRTRLERWHVDQLSEKVWRLTWYEVWTPTYGQGSRTMRVTGEFTVERRLRAGPFGRWVMSVADANRSPLALFVTDYWWIEEWEDEPFAH